MKHATCSTFNAHPFRLLLLCSALSTCLSVQAATAAAAHDGPVPTITLYEITANGSEKSCSLSGPGTASGETVEFHINDAGSACHGVRPHSIRITNAPSATRFLLTDDWHCSKTLGSSYHRDADYSTNKNFWIELSTTRSLSVMAKIGVDKLFDYDGYLTNQSPDGTAKSLGFKVTGQEAQAVGERVAGNLSCIRMITSAGPATPEPTPVAAVSWDGRWEAIADEYDHGDFTCPSTKVLAAREHDGDERGKSRYGCVSVGSGDEIRRDQLAWSVEITESGTERKDDESLIANKNDRMDYIDFSCPANKILVGRSHVGDENGTTRYQCAALFKGSSDNKNNQLTVKPGAWQTEMKEKDSRFSCEAGQVLIGRAHQGDENGNTRYRCGTLHLPRTAQ